MKEFKPSKVFKKEYDRLYKNDPQCANMLLLLCELANEKGEVYHTEEELTHLYNLRFDSPNVYALGGTINE